MQENIVVQNPPTQTVFVCHVCNYPVLPDFYFCPNCGKVLRAKPLATSIGKQISIYLFSFFLPPFGLWPAFKYLFQKDTKSKIVGIVAIVLTVVSLVISTYYLLDFFDKANQFIGSQSLGGL